MSFRINTNTVAASALYNLNLTGDNLSQSIQRLSTGLRINSGADDPSGLIISEKYKAEITGLGQAIKNSQDGVNFAKTADGALSEVSNLLNTARGLAVGAANSGTLSSSQLAADQTELKSIISSITRISQNTQFGDKKLLDGTAGVTSSVTDPNKLDSLSIGGTFNSAQLTTGGDATVQVTAAATQATVNGSVTYATAATNVGAGSISINGVTFTTTANDTVQTLLNSINASESSTGVHASYDSTAKKIVLQSDAYGTAAKVQLTDTTGLINAASTTVNGTAATANLTLNGTTVAFTGSLNGNDGLTLTDADGNQFRLTPGGNVVGAGSVVGQVTVGSSQFQIGSEVGQTVNLSLGNFAASQLGTGIVTGKNLSNLDLTTTQGANDAIRVIDQAITQITSARGQIGSFQADVLQSNIRSLGVAQTNLQSANSTISDTDVAAEYTNYTKEQILQQSGISVLAQANQLPQQVLKLLG